MNIPVKAKATIIKDRKDSIEVTKAYIIESGVDLKNLFLCGFKMVDEEIFLDFIKTIPQMNENNLLGLCLKKECNLFLIFSGLNHGAQEIAFGKSLYCASVVLDLMFIDYIKINSSNDFTSCLEEIRSEEIHEWFPHLNFNINIKRTLH